MAEGCYRVLGQDQKQTDDSLGGHHEHDERSSCGSNSSNVREQDQLIPVANVIRIMRKVLPAHAKVADDAKETIQDCVSEFISFITSEANERCQREQRKTITADDLLWAMGKLGLDEYIEPLSIFLHKYREIEGDQRGSFRGELLPPFKKETTQAPFALPANYNHPFSMVPSFSNYPVTQYPGAFYNNNGLTDGFYRDAANGASISSASFDPFVHLKY